MSTPRTIGPFDFFSREALGAGWYLVWRQFLWLLLVVFVFMIVAAIVVGAIVLAFFSAQDLPRLASQMGLLIGVGVLVGVVFFVTYIIAWVLVTNRIARGWAAKRGHRLAQGIFLEYVWRVIVVGVLTSIVLGAVNLAAGAVLPEVGVVLVAVTLFIANIVVTLQANGWAVSAAVVKKLGGMAAVASTATAGPPMTPPPMRAAETGAPATATMSAPPPPRTPPGERMQCPKCGLSETERGAVIGWYCKVCGWREGRR